MCLTGEAFEQSPAARLLADFAGRRLERLCANARETLALCEGENGPLHYAAACGMDVQLTADLAAAAAGGYAALHDALIEATTGPDMAHIPYPVTQDMVFDAMRRVETL